MEDEGARSNGEVDDLGSVEVTTALRLRKGIDNEAFVHEEEEGGEIESDGHSTARRRLDFDEEERPRLYRRNAKRFNQKSVILSRIKFRANESQLAASDRERELALSSRIDVTNGAKENDLEHFKTCRRLAPSSDNNAITVTSTSQPRDVELTNEVSIYVEEVSSGRQSRNETEESDRVATESICATAEIFSGSLDFGGVGSQLDCNGIRANSFLINDRFNASSLHCSIEDPRLTSECYDGDVFWLPNQSDLCDNSVGFSSDVRFVRPEDVNSPVGGRRSQLEPSGCCCFDVDCYCNGRGSISLCTSSRSAFDQEEVGVFVTKCSHNNKLNSSPNNSVVVVALTDDQMIGCNCNAAAATTAENVASLAADGTVRGSGGNASSSVAPSHLLPRRHMSNTGIAGGNDSQQPPPLPPARQRTNLSANNSNCCCCNSGGCHLRALSPQSADRAAPNRMRRDRRPMVDGPPSMSRPPPPPPPPPPPSVPPHGNDGVTMLPMSTNVLNPELLPDILNSHLPPPYSTLPHTNEHSSRRGLNPSSSIVPPPPPPPLPTASSSSTVPPSPPRRSRSERFPLPRPSHRRNRGQRSTPRGTHYTPEDEPKNCCGVAVTQTVSIRWFIVMIAFVGLCCAVVGTVLGALKATGREHLTVSLLMIGVGIVLITVSGIAWRLTSHDAPSCRMMLGLHSEEPEPNRRFVPRVPPSYGRPHHPYAAMMYPEFQYRPPPPSYQASMQEYRLRLLLLDRHQPTPSTSHSPVSPPPTYRSNAGGNSNTFTRPPIHFTRENDYSRPPSYRSRASSVNPNPGTTSESSNPAGPNSLVQTTVAGVHNNNNNNNTNSQHSRDPSLSLSLLSHESLFDVAVPLSDRQSGCSNNSSPQTPSEMVPVATTTRSIVRLDPTVGESRVTRGNQRHSMEDRSNQGLTKDNHDYAEVPMVASGRTKRPHDCNVVTIVQTTNSSRVLGGSVSQDQGTSVGIQVHRTSPGEMEILAHL